MRKKGSFEVVVDLELGDSALEDELELAADTLHGRSLAGGSESGLRRNCIAWRPNAQAWCTEAHATIAPVLPL
jgi:hypothetical protein